MKRQRLRAKAEQQRKEARENAERAHEAESERLEALAETNKARQADAERQARKAESKRRQEADRRAQQADADKRQIAYKAKKNPGGFPFFQWIAEFRDLSSMGSCFPVI